MLCTSSLGRLPRRGPRSGRAQATRLGAVTVLEKPVPLELLEAELRQAIAHRPKELDLNAVLEEIEDRLIREALERSQGNRKQAADALGINRTTLVEKLRRKSRR
jgi:DNA-binding NtrC family response regulator